MDSPKTILAIISFLENPHSLMMMHQALENPRNRHDTASWKLKALFNALNES